MKSQAVDFDGCHDEDEENHVEKITSEKIMVMMRKKSCGNSAPRIGRSSNWKNLRKKVAVCWFCRLAPGEAVSSGTMTWASSRATSVHEVNARNTKPMKARSDGKKRSETPLQTMLIAIFIRFILMIGHLLYA